MKRKIWMGIALCLLLSLTAMVFLACGEKNEQATPDDSDANNGENTAIVKTVEISNLTERSANTYSIGETIRLKAEASPDSTFVCWTAQGVPFSYEKETVYTVTEDAVVRAVYAKTGRVTLDPRAHIDPMGLISLLFIHFGWGKPVMINPNNFKNRRRDSILVGLAGVTMNLIVAIVAGFILKILVTAASGLMATTVGTSIGYVIVEIVIINISLMLFNLLPEKFTLKEVQTAYEAVSGLKVDTPNFRRGIVSRLIPTGGYRQGRRAAMLYRFNPLYVNMEGN